MAQRFCTTCEADVEDVDGFCLLGHSLKVASVMPSIDELRAEVDEAFKNAQAEVAQVLSVPFPVVAPAEGPQGVYIRATVKARVASEEGLAQELRTLCRRHLPAFLVPSDFRVDERHVYQFKGKPANQMGAAGDERPNPNE